jgi:hypothetical protein
LKQAINRGFDELRFSGSARAITAGIVCGLLTLLGYSQTVSSGFQFANGLFLGNPDYQKTYYFMVRFLIFRGLLLIIFITALTDYCFGCYNICSFYW